MRTSWAPHCMESSSPLTFVYDIELSSPLTFFSNSHAAILWSPSAAKTLVTGLSIRYL